METTTETIEILNDLIAINNDRIRGYENAIEETTDETLKELFGSMIVESRFIRIELAEEVQNMGGEFEAGTTVSGKAYRAWTDVKSVFTGVDTYTILSNCEHSEDATQDAYNNALGSEDLQSYIHALLQKQQQILKGSHNKIKSMRNDAK
jgi:uncharacterized protein (TIGR02284 family)